MNQMIKILMKRICYKITPHKKINYDYYNNCNLTIDEYKSEYINVFRFITILLSYIYFLRTPLNIFN